ncbi:hypothetical protein CYY_006730 [Polysphondylium violaceum]|uniref:F-box domain-containing protein n=1 Tax=Polysphondylium violaceum TaxID=133409 RepID=A0A8J4UY29_9MYCE|nr:hypothetical protein CYY_006730 [Polysphondylium violaceum]
MPALSKACKKTNTYNNNNNLNNMNNNNNNNNSIQGFLNNIFNSIFKKKKNNVQPSQQIANNEKSSSDSLGFENSICASNSSSSKYSKFSLLDFNLNSNNSSNSSIESEYINNNSNTRVLSNRFSKNNSSKYLNNVFELQEIDIFAIQELPEEVVVKISTYFSVEMMYNMSLTSSNFYRLMNDIGLWKLKVQEKYSGKSNQHSLLSNKMILDNQWKNYYHIKSLISQTKGNVSSTVLKTKGSSPSARYQHTGTVIGNSIYYIGGQETQVRRFDDIFKYDSEKNRFYRIECSGTPPPKFARHTSVAIQNKIYCFGGFDGSGIYFELSIFDPEKLTWTTATVSGNPPRSRTNHAAAAVGSKLYVYGGINRDGRWELQDLDEFFVFDTTDLSWREVKATGDVPTARCGHRLVSIGKKLYMFGGGAGDSWRERYNDIHIFDTETNVWRRIESPQPNVVHVCTFSSVFVMGSFIGVFGGQHLIRGKVTKKLYFFDVISETWSKQEFSGNSPNPRDMASANVLNNRVYVFGGYDGRAMDDMNVFDLSPKLKSLINTKFY